MRNALRLTLSALLVLIAVSAAPPASRAESPAGLYSAHGKAPNGSSYDGEVKIVDAGYVYGIAWNLTRGDSYAGFALREGNVLGSAYVGANGAPFGLAVYRIDGGRLTGRWIDSGKGPQQLGEEVLVGSADLEGDYRIEKGVLRDGKTYGGDVRIQRKGDIYLVSWGRPNPSSVGIGLRMGNVLVVGYGEKTVPGVVAYSMSGTGAMVGDWAAGPGGDTGTETLKPK